jgi:hypothetical protein
MFAASAREERAITPKIAEGGAATVVIVGPKALIAASHPPLLPALGRMSGLASFQSVKESLGSKRPDIARHRHLLPAGLLSCLEAWSAK